MVLFASSNPVFLLVTSSFFNAVHPSGSHADVVPMRVFSFPVTKNQSFVEEEKRYRNTAVYDSKRCRTVCFLRIQSEIIRGGEIGSKEGQKEEKNGREVGGIQGGDQDTRKRHTGRETMKRKSDGQHLDT